MKDVKTEKVTIPYPLTDQAKADAADRLLELQTSKKALDDERQGVIKEYKENIQQVENKMDYEFSLLKKGVREEEVECKIRKNFSVQPPMLQYIDPKDDKTIIHEIELPGDQYQLSAGDWVIDDQGTESVVPAMETIHVNEDNEDDVVGADEES